MKTYDVQIPIAGHAWVTVEAADRDDAISKAMDLATIEKLEEWKPLEQFNQGNVCYCPKPWEVSVFDEDGTEVDE